MKRASTAYWVFTGAFCLAFAVGGAAHLVRAQPMAESMEKLGYPAYVMTILGVAKLLGVTALLAPGKPLLKEWAYAGFTFDLLGATVSHAFAGDPISEMIPPVLLLAVGAASYLLRPAPRRLAASPAGRGPGELDRDRPGRALSAEPAGDGAANTGS